MDKLYQEWRKDGGPTLYGPMKTSVTADVLECGLLFCLAILFFSLTLLLIGLRGKKRWLSSLKAFFGVTILGSILLSNFGQEWEVATIHTRTQYRAGLREDINATIGAKIGLRSINITLQGNPARQTLNNGKVNETIDYNERFSWDNQGFILGRAGFGPFAGKFNQEFRAAQRKGLPYPILWIAEYFTIDGEGVRWGRHYLQAGYFSHILIWTAFPLWLMSLVLFSMVKRYAAYFCILTSLTLIGANVIWMTLRNPLDLRIPFENGFMEFSWGWSFWLCLASGIVCFFLGAVVFILEAFFPEWVTFFDIDMTEVLEGYYVDPRELDVGIDGKANEGYVDYEYEDFETLDLKNMRPPEFVGKGFDEDGDEDKNVKEVVRKFRVNTIMGPRPRLRSGEGPRMVLRKHWRRESLLGQKNEESKLSVRRPKSIMPPKKKKSDVNFKGVQFSPENSPNMSHL